MRRLALVLAVLPALTACATHGSTSTGRSVDAVAQDEGQRQKVLSAIDKGDTPTQAMAKVADGPKTSGATPAQPAPNPK